MNERVSKRAVLVIATLSSLLTPFMISSVNIALPSIAREFGIDNVVLSSVTRRYFGLASGSVGTMRLLVMMKGEWGV